MYTYGPDSKLVIADRNSGKSKPTKELESIHK